jgi:predicted ATPase
VLIALASMVGRRHQQIQLRLAPQMLTGGLMSDRIAATNEHCQRPCACKLVDHGCRLVVLTGGPGAGKTALLELVRRNFCDHVAVLPESASIIFGGGFPRHFSEPGRRAAQRAIYRVQQELEALVRDEGKAAVALCDRGSLDGLAYWPGPPDSFFRELGTTAAREFERYAAVIHLRTPGIEGAYNRRNPLRIESAREALAIDGRIAEAWHGHPRVLLVDEAPNFLDKVARALELIRQEVPACCRSHEIPGVPCHSQAPAGGSH